MAPKVRLRLEPYDPDARDADGDGIIQEGTAWERPAGTRLISELGEEIARGLTSESRPRLRVIDSNGRERPYTPSYGSAGLDTSDRARITSAPKLMSLKDRGYPTVGDLLASGRFTPARTEPRRVEPTADERSKQVRASVESLVRTAPMNQQFPKRAARDRAKRKADNKAQELAFLGGDHVVIETDTHFVVLPQSEYKALSDTYGEEALRGAIGVELFERPRPKIADLSEERDSLRGPVATEGEIDKRKYLDGVMSVHYGNGSLDDVEDDVFAAVMFDENLTDESGYPLENVFGGPLTFEDIMIGNHDFLRGTTFENRRFTITALKDENAGENLGGLWSVYRFEDKETGKYWYIKTSTYACHDGMLESIGMRAASLTDLAAKPDAKHIKTGSKITIFKEGQRDIRWIAMRDIDDWDTPSGQSLSWATANDAGGIDTATVDVGDIAQIAILDFVLDNQDRHGGNYMLARDADGNQRVGVIDNGLLFGGRIYDVPHTSIKWDAEPTDDDWRRYMDFRKDLDVASYSVGGPDSLGQTILQQWGVTDLASRFSNEKDSQRFDEASEAMIKNLESQLESLLDPAYFSERSTPLTPSERDHLDAMLTVAKIRLGKLQSNPRLIRDWFENNLKQMSGITDEENVA